MAPPDAAYYISFQAIGYLIDVYKITAYLLESGLKVDHLSKFDNPFRTWYNAPHAGDSSNW